MSVEVNFLHLALVYAIGAFLTVFLLWHDRYLHQEEKLWYWAVLLGTVLLYPIAIPVTGLVHAIRLLYLVMFVAAKRLFRFFFYRSYS